jgi:hypothetical protein
LPCGGGAGALCANASEDVVNPRSVARLRRRRAGTESMRDVVMFSIERQLGGFIEFS